MMLILTILGGNCFEACKANNGIAYAHSNIFCFVISIIRMQYT